MSTAPATHTPWETDLVSTGPLVNAAHALTANDAGQRTAPLVVVVRPGTGDQCVVGAGGNNALRAAVATAVAGGAPAWFPVGGGTDELPVRGLPDSLRAVAEGSGITRLVIGSVTSGGQVACAALWFAGDADGPDEMTRSSTLALLGSAAEKDDAERAERAAAAPTPEHPSLDDDRITLRVGVDDDPDVDALTGLASRIPFDAALEDFEGDEAALLLADLDGFDTVNAAHGTDAGDEVLREIARRLLGESQAGDLLVRLEGDRFAVLLRDSSRSHALQTAKRWLSAISGPLPADAGPAAITATIAMAHQIGMVDTEELLESAEDAVESGKRSGRGRVVIAS